VKPVHDQNIENFTIQLPASKTEMVHAALGAPLMEIALATPPLPPQEQWAPVLKILNQKELFTFGEIQVPQGRVGYE